MGRQSGKYNSRSPPIAVNYSSTALVARMERSAIRVLYTRPPSRISLALHPGYERQFIAPWRGPPRIRANSSAVGQESAGNPYFTCIALTAVRLNCPITPSTLPTL